MTTLSEQDTRALVALATYHYLTPSQMERLGVGKKREYIRDYTLRRLTQIRPALIKGHDFGVIPRIGRLERVYHLTEKGAKEVAELWQVNVSEIIFPRYGLRFQNDYFHRKAFIDFHIGLRLWVSEDFHQNLEFFHAYYLKNRNRKSINQFGFKPSQHFPPNYRKTIEPDGLFRLHQKEKAFLCAVEIHRKPDTKYITEQLDRHITAIDQMIISERFEHPEPNIVLSVHEHLSSFRGVQKRLQELKDFEAFTPFFHFNLMENIRGDFSTGWITADEKQSLLFKSTENQSLEIP